MTSDTDYPRQRTVAELLAEHGNGAPTGRRRRRRAADDEADQPAAEPMAVAPPPATDPATGSWAATTAEPDRSMLREPVPDDPGIGVASRWDDAPAYDSPTYDEPTYDAQAYDPPAYDPPAALADPEPAFRLDPEPAAPDYRFDDPPPASPAPARPRLDSPTEHIPLIAGEPLSEIGRTSPVERLRRASPRWQDALDILRAESGRTAPAVDRPEPDDGGPPTQAGGGWELDELDGRYGGNGTAARSYSAAPHATDAPAVRAYPAGPYAENGYAAEAYRAEPDEIDPEQYADEQYADELYDDEPDEPDEPSRRADAAEDPDLQPRWRLGRASAAVEGSGSFVPAWAMVFAQWILGALGGAALWVGFRVLWRSLPVVALAAAVLIIIGLVVLVRALLRNDDRRTTALAVGVGLLLTVSPALLVLLDR